MCHEDVVKDGPTFHEASLIGTDYVWEDGLHSTGEQFR
jgi:hypothetical protein